MTSSSTRVGRAVSLLLMLLASSMPAKAAVIAFDTFGPGDSYDTTGRYAVDGNASFQAFLFVPTASGPVEQITVALGRETIATTQTRFQLFDGTGVALGNLLETIDVPNLVVPGQSPGAAVSVGSLAQPVLTAGQNYWLSFSEPGLADGSRSFWFFNDQGLAGTRLTSQLPAQSNTLPAFRIVLADVGEPPLALLLVLGLFGGVLGTRRRARGRGTR